MEGVEVFVVTDQAKQKDDCWPKFRELTRAGCADRLMSKFGFERVDIIMEGLRERVTLLEKLQKEHRLEELFLDPEYGLYARPLLDIAFLHLPDAFTTAINSKTMVPLRCTTTPPTTNQPFFAVAYHDSMEVFDNELYASTIMGSRLDAGDFVMTGRSCTLGRVSS